MYKILVFLKKVLIKKNKNFKDYFKGNFNRDRYEKSSSVILDYIKINLKREFLYDFFKIIIDKNCYLLT